jgi:cell division protein FtsQ
VRAAFLISDRRWDLQLENGISIRLPQDNIDAALADLVKMDEESGLLSRDIVAIDMRLADRVTVRLSDEAAEQRKVMTGGKGRSGKKERDT